MTIKYKTHVQVRDIPHLLKLQRTLQLRIPFGTEESEFFVLNKGKITGVGNLNFSYDFEKTYTQNELVDKMEKGFLDILKDSPVYVLVYNAEEALRNTTDEVFKFIPDGVDWSKTLTDVINAGVSCEYQHSDHEFRKDDREVYSLNNEKFGGSISMDSLNHNHDNVMYNSFRTRLLELWNQHCKRE
jgi:hypothetical protein